MDPEGTWYRSTVLGIRTIISEGQEQREVNIGFRVYEAGGYKSDGEENPDRKYTGWSNKFDEWKSVTCVTI